MQARVVRIDEPDFGCEGRMDEQVVLDRVQLEVVGTGEVIYTRADDAAETVLNRLDTYHKITEPLKDYYSATGKLVIVEGQEEVADTTRLTLAAVEG